MSVVTAIGTSAFENCSSLTTVTIPEEVTSIGYGAFNGCADNFKIVSTADAYAITYAKDEDNLHKYIMTDSVEQAVVILSTSTYKYDGKAKMPTPMVKVYNKTLKKGVDYIVEYKNNINVGNATVIITGMDDYSGTITKTFKINPVTLTKAEVKLSTTSYTYDGNKKVPAVTLTWNSKTFKVTSIAANAFYAKATIKVPAKQLTAYKKILKGTGLSSKVVIVKY